MALSSAEKKEILAEYGLHDTDTGSPEAQVALLSKRISDLTEHSRFISTITIRVVACCSSLVVASVCSSTLQMSTLSVTAP